MAKIFYIILFLSFGGLTVKSEKVRIRQKKLVRLQVESQGAFGNESLDALDKPAAQGYPDNPGSPTYRKTKVARIAEAPPASSKEKPPNFYFALVRQSDSEEYKFYARLAHFKQDDCPAYKVNPARIKQDSIVFRLYNLREFDASMAPGAPINADKLVGTGVWPKIPSEAILFHRASELVIDNTVAQMCGDAAVYVEKRSTEDLVVRNRTSRSRKTTRTFRLDEPRYVSEWIEFFLMSRLNRAPPRDFNVRLISGAAGKVMGFPHRVIWSDLDLWIGNIQDIKARFGFTAHKGENGNQLKFHPEKDGDQDMLVLYLIKRMLNRDQSSRMAMHEKALLGSGGAYEAWEKLEKDYRTGMLDMKGKPTDKKSPLFLGLKEIVYREVWAEVERKKNYKDAKKLHDEILAKTRDAAKAKAVYTSDNTPANSIPEIDAWDPLNENEKIITRFVFSYWEGRRAAHWSDWQVPRGTYFTFAVDGPLPQLAFKIAMLSGARQLHIPPIGAAFGGGNPFRVDTCGEQPLPKNVQHLAVDRKNEGFDPILIKYTDALDIICAFAFVTNYGTEHWNNWVDYIVDGAADGHWAHNGPASDLVFRAEVRYAFDPETGAQTEVTANKANHIKNWMKLYLRSSQKFWFQFYLFDEGGKTLGTGHTYGDAIEKTPVAFLNGLVRGEIIFQEFYDQVSLGVDMRRYKFGNNLRLIDGP